MARKSRNTNHRMLSVKDIMKRYSVSYQTVNHYTDFGLLPVPLKKRNVRFYERRLLEKRMDKIQRLIKEGYSLRLVRKKLIGI